MIYGCVAQVVEHLTFNQVVRGSNPRTLTIKKHGCQMAKYRAFLVFMRFFKDMTYLKIIPLKVTESNLKFRKVFVP